MPFVFYKHNKEKYTHNDRESITPIVFQVFYFFENVSVSLERKILPTELNSTWVHNMILVKLPENTKGCHVEYVCDISVQYNKIVQWQGITDKILHVKSQ